MRKLTTKQPGQHNLLCTYPSLAEQWHPTKNGSLTPRDVTPGSGKRVWWICDKGHEWEAAIHVRTSKETGCPYCHSATSQLELRIYSEMKYLFGHVQHRKKVHGVECDIFIPELSVGIEVDATYWHINRFQQDTRKAAALRKRGIGLVNVREKGLKRISDKDIVFSSKDSHFKVVCAIAKKLSEEVTMNESSKNSILAYLKRKTTANDSEYKQMLEMLPSPLPGDSLLEQNPILAGEWHPTRNGNLTPRNVTLHSGKKVWWICNRQHEWEAVIDSRAKGSGCPYCAGQLVHDDNCLGTLNPSLAEEWHPTKNGSLTPRDVTLHTDKRVWWMCGKGHDWEAPVARRARGSGCPYCVRQALPSGNSLEAVNPKLAMQWHPTKNGSLTPRDVWPHSGRKVWWICNRRHEWKAAIGSRAKGSGCPYCAGKLVHDDNCLETLNPSLAKQWHPTKNRSLTPRDVTLHTAKKIWWICDKSHEWEARTSHRVDGVGCPYCSGQAVCEDNCLQTVNSTLAGEWHPTRNGKLTPRHVMPSSGKKVWWICRKGHEWKAYINNRAKGAGCPYCSGQAVCHDNCLQTLNPPLAQEWHPTKNGRLTPWDVTPGSGRRVWWICKKGHQWEAAIGDRGRGGGCPYCAGKAVCEDNCLQTVNPSLAKEWHPTRNSRLTPKDVTAGSGKKVWWLCRKGHQWEATIGKRSNGRGCPYCAGRTSGL